MFVAPQRGLQPRAAMKELRLPDQDRNVARLDKRAFSPELAVWSGSLREVAAKSMDTWARLTAK